MFQAVHQKVIRRDAERIRDLDQGFQAGPAFPYFNVADMFVVHTNPFSKGFLGEPFPGSEVADAFSKFIVVNSHYVPRFPSAHISHDIISSKKNT